ncbi:MAG: response regulator [Breznakibacter sp.]
MRRVLVVEDDRFISTIFKMFLSELGHELVGRCETGSRAIELCHQLKPDVILMDIHLQGELDGIQTAEKLKTELDIPVIYISGDTSNLIIERAIVSNSYGYLVKPVNKKELGISIDLAYFKHRVDVDQKKRERGYREFISESPVPIVIVRNKKIQYLNKLALDSIMKTHYIEDVMWLDFERFVADESKQKVRELLDKPVSEENRFVDEYVLMKDLHGDQVHVEISGCSVRFNDEMAYQLIIRDVTGRVLQKRKAAFYRELLLDSDKPVVILDPLFNLLVCNHQAKEEFPALHHSAENFAHAVKKAAANNKDKLSWFEVSVADPDGEWLSMRAVGVCSGVGTVGEWVVTR